VENPFNLESISAFNREYDRIEYLAERVQSVRKAAITDDWLLNFYTTKWSEICK
jgi:hypothetical protein